MTPNHYVSPTRITATIFFSGKINKEKYIGQIRGQVFEHLSGGEKTWALLQQDFLNADRDNNSMAVLRRIFGERKISCPFQPAPLAVLISYFV
jgi:hypothetical protein